MDYTILICRGTCSNEFHQEQTHCAATSLSRNTSPTKWPLLIIHSVLAWICEENFGSLSCLPWPKSTKAANITWSHCKLLLTTTKLYQTHTTRAVKSKSHISSAQCFPDTLQYFASTLCDWNSKWNVSMLSLSGCQREQPSASTGQLGWETEKGSCAAPTIITLITVILIEIWL